MPDPAGELALDDSFTVHTFVSSMLPTRGRQGIVTRWDSRQSAGWALYVDDNGRLTFEIGDGNGGTARVRGDRVLFPSRFA